MRGFTGHYWGDATYEATSYYRIILCAAVVGPSHTGRAF